MFNTTDQCITLQSLVTDACDKMFYYFSGRTTWLHYTTDVVMPPGTGCMFKFNGTRSSIQINYTAPAVVYFTSNVKEDGDIPVFENSVDSVGPGPIYWDNSWLMIISNGDSTKDKTNYFNFLLVNPDVNPSTITFITYQAAMMKIICGFIVFSLMLSYLF